ncbi:hypothetical protein MUN88_20800 [Gracilibacillus caseinilyticus]|uniref:Uncharacterized protein n=1 Tax=Gracilibacillus caseinilyticus TaxID=2932256 RepID=A0ABY4EVY4_9BACI|nr:hypothetical protein [Gracilibacillus caseinilyticus]UOQ48439.1 hypothetical protein MUN88_20800 [Gracilibacillus caseinilyticus]
MWSFIAVLGLGLLLSPSAFAEEQTTMKFYDASGEEVHPYTDEELEHYINGGNSFNSSDRLLESKTISTAAVWRKYYFGSVTINYSWFISGGTIWDPDTRSFYNPGAVNIGETSGDDSLTVHAYDEDNTSTPVSTIEIDYGVAGVSVPFTHLSRGESYYFELEGDGITINSGNVWYDQE